MNDGISGPGSTRDVFVCVDDVECASIETRPTRDRVTCWFSDDPSSACVWCGCHSNSVGCLCFVFDVRPLGQVSVSVALH